MLITKSMNFINLHFWTYLNNFRQIMVCSCLIPSKWGMCYTANIILLVRDKGIHEAMFQSRSQGPRAFCSAPNLVPRAFSLALGAGREKVLASAGHVSILPCQTRRRDRQITAEIMQTYDDL